MVTTRRSWAARCCIMGAVWLMMIGAVAWGDDWTPINCPSADLPPEAMFDTVRTVDSFEESPLRWQAASGEQNAHCHLVRDTATCRDGQGALRVDYDFVGQRQYEYLQLGMPLQIPTEGLAFGFWLKHDGHSFPVRLRIVDKSGETHQIDLMSRTVADWQFVACSLDGPGSSWGGDGNGRLDYPCRLEGIVIDRPRGGFVGKGSLWIDGAALLRHRSTSSTLQVVTRETAMGNLFAVGASIHLRAHGKGDKIRWQWSDYWGHVLAQGEGSATGTRADFVLPRPAILYVAWNCPTRTGCRRWSSTVALRLPTELKRRAAISWGFAPTMGITVIHFRAWTCCAATASISSGTKSPGNRMNAGPANTRCQNMRRISCDTPPS